MGRRWPGDFREGAVASECEFSGSLSKRQPHLPFRQPTLRIVVLNGSPHFSVLAEEKGKNRNRVGAVIQVRKYS